ncbi:hypothetical protein B296_00049075 [Ensete ventricosum]|uniref:Uncharacterized protein n=1 Tax=Ensete ventricosum TaxID=4639 RepID=A0A426WXN2_ENSVE|nr:hypothetical protein B296_00049075 [Ensete ventricosum]
MRTLRDWMVVEGVVGLGMAGRGATLVLCTSWFNCSSWIRTKLGWKVEARVTAIVVIAWEGGGMDDSYRGNKIAALISDDRTLEGVL